MQRKRRYLTAISIEAGIIKLINERGEVEVYRQRGIQNMEKEKIRRLVGLGFLNRRWARVPELPKDISISYEDEALMGRARATYPKIEV